MNGDLVSHLRLDSSYVARSPNTVGQIEMPFPDQRTGHSALSFSNANIVQEVIAVHQRYLLHKGQEGFEGFSLTLKAFHVK